MFKKFGRICFDLSFILFIGFSLAGLIATFMSIFITWTTTWDTFFEALGTAFTAVALSPTFFLYVLALALSITGFLFKEKIYTFITEKSVICKKVTDIFSVIVYTTMLAMGVCAAFAQFIYFCERFEGLNYVFEAIGKGGDITLAAIFTLGFTIATWIQRLVTIFVIGFFIGLTIYKFVKYVKSNKQTNVVAPTINLGNDEAAENTCQECTCEYEASESCDCANENEIENSHISENESNENID